MAKIEKGQGNGVIVFLVARTNYYHNTSKTPQYRFQEQRY